MSTCCSDVIGFKKIYFFKINLLFFQNPHFSFLFIHFFRYEIVFEGYLRSLL